MILAYLQILSSQEQLNIAKYTVQKSTDGINYTEIGVVNANNLSSFRYTYTDPLAGSGLIYYRLKITDNNGRVALSSIVSLTVKVNGSMVIFPNPVTDFFTVQITGAFTKQEARIYDTKGRLLKTVLIATSTQKINVSEFARGIYLIKFSDSSVYKISKQ